MRLTSAILFVGCLILAGIVCSPAQARCPGGECNATFRPRAVHVYAPRPQAVNDAGDWYPGKLLAQGRLARRGS